MNPQPRQLRRIGMLVLACALPWLASCVSVAEYRKLEYDVAKLKKRHGVGGESRAGVADLAAEMDALKTEIATLGGRLEVAEHRVAEALEEARAARKAAHTSGGPATNRGSEPEEPDPATTAPEELKAYREAYSAWRADETQTCIDRFRDFLQTHPASSYADDAAYWLADCHFKQGDYRTAVLRFDDVAGRYPTGNKAADALYRQGEALIRLGYEEAAAKAFERVVNEYPDSGRAAEARKQVDLIRGSG